VDGQWASYDDEIGGGNLCELVNAKVGSARPYQELKWEIPTYMPPLPRNRGSAAIFLDGQKEPIDEGFQARRGHR